MLNKRLSEFYIFVPMVIAYFILGIFYPFLRDDIAKFILFQLLFLLLPGYIFSKWFISEDLTKIQRLIFGYPVSMVIIFILSWIGNLLNIKYLESLILLFSIISIYTIFTKDIYGDRKLQSSYLSAPIAVSMLFYCICITIVFRMFIIPSSPPTLLHLGLFYQDSLWTVGNTWAYIRGFPLQDPRFLGVPFGYHMLQNIYQATVFRFTKIHPFYMHFYIEPVFDWWIMIFLIVYGAIKIARLNLRKIVIFCIGLFFSNAFLGKGLQLTLFVNPLSLYFGLPVFILFIFFIIGYVGTEKKLDIIYMSILFIYFTATKAILGIIVPIVLGVFFLFRFFKKKYPSYKREFLLLFGLFAGAILLKSTMFQNTICKLNYNYNYDPTISVAYQLLKQASFLTNYSDIIYPFYRFISNIFRNLPNYIFNWPILLFVVLLFISGKFRREAKGIKNIIVFTSIFFLASVIMGAIFVPLGGAPFYYIWYSQVIFLILGAYALDYILTQEKKEYKIVAVSLLFISVMLFSVDLFNWVKIGWSGLPNVKERVWDDRASISYDEWLAMGWLQKNTNPYETFFSDRRYFAHEVSGVRFPRFFGYTALSGRQAFAEGYFDEGYYSDYGKEKSLDTERWNLIDKFLSSSDRAEQKRILKDIQADYFVQSLRFNNRNFSEIENLVLVYKNKDAKIFKLSR